MTILSRIRGVRNRKKPAKGRLIVLDGTDGTGKTTQTKLLVETLQQNGHRVEIADFPQYGRQSASLVEAYLNGDYGTELNPHASSLFYAIDRFDASFKIREWLDDGIIVISNRYVTSNAGHQGGKIADKYDRLKFYKWLDNLEYTILGIPKPDLTIILHIPAEQAQKLAKQKTKEQKAHLKNGKQHDIHEADLKHLKQAEQVYLEVAKLFPKTKLIECVDEDGILPPKLVHNKIWELVRRIALKGVNPQ